MEAKKGFIYFIMNPKKWWIPLMIIFVVSVVGVAMIGYETYYEAPPIPDYVTESGDTLYSKKQILDGQATFQRLALMDFGSMFGDGANRGPDITAHALHQVSIYISDFHGNQPDLTKLAFLGVKEQVRRELKDNRYQKLTNSVTVTPALEFSGKELGKFYSEYFRTQKSLSAIAVTATDIKNLTA